MPRAGPENHTVCSQVSSWEQDLTLSSRDYSNHPEPLQTQGTEVTQHPARYILYLLQGMRQTNFHKVDVPKRTANHTIIHLTCYWPVDINTRLWRDGDPSLAIMWQLWFIFFLFKLDTPPFCHLSISQAPDENMYVLTTLNCFGFMKIASKHKENINCAKILILLLCLSK